MSDIKNLEQIIENYISHDVKSPVNIRGTFTDYGVANVSHGQRPLMGFGKLNQFDDEEEECSDEDQGLETKVKIRKPVNEEVATINEILNTIEEYAYEEKLFSKIRNPFQTHKN
mgnify:CR=1 FL=1